MKSTKRRCPACKRTKTFREDQLSCGCRGTNPNIASLDTSARETYLRKENEKLKSQLDLAYARQGFQEEIADQIMMSVSALDPLPLLPYKSGKKAESEMAAVLQLSDWHIGEVISSSETNGFGNYNWKIAQDRATYIAEKFIGWLDVNRASFKIPKVYIFGQADWVSGDIHKELVSTNEFPLPVQTVRAGELLANVIGRIAPYAPELHVVEIEPDNHGRLNPKPQFKQKATNNMSFVTYAVANGLLQKHANVHFVNEHRIRELVNVQGIKFLVEHGDVVRSWQGVPYMGMMRHAGKEANKHMRALLEQDRAALVKLKQEYGFDYMALGHFHVPNIIDNQILVNGSLSGTSEFDNGVGRWAKPAQVAFLVHPRHGVFNWVPFGVKA